MAARYRKQAYYVAVVGTLAVLALGATLPAELPLPSLPAVVFCVAACLFVWQFGLPAPAIGLVSLERVPQVGMLLAFQPATAALIGALASAIWPFMNRRYNQGSFKVATLRGLHNAAMTTAMMLLAGMVYELLGGRRPLADFTAADLAPLVGMALALQGVNIAMMAIFFWLDERDVRRLFTPVYLLADLLFVPAGVLAATLHARPDATPFALYAAVLVLMVASFNAIARTTRSSADELAVLSKASAAGQALRGAQRLDTLSERLAAQCRALFKFDEFYFVLVDHARNELDIRLHQRGDERLPRRRKPSDVGVFGWVARSGKPLLVEDWDQAPKDLTRRADPTNTDNRSVIVVPLALQGFVMGLISVQDSERGRFSAADLYLMRRLAESAAVALADALAYEELDDYKLRLEQRVAERTLELEQANQDKERLLEELRGQSLQLERQSREDPLTGLANRRVFDERLRLELARAERRAGSFALCLLDLDHFKRINDNLGHAIGDAVLREAADIMRHQCRAIDLIARYGGEEFALILPDSDGVAAARLCERIRATMEQADWFKIHADLHTVTLSAGVAYWSTGMAGDELVGETDRRLYEAKRNGRNRVWACL